jgi:cellulose synthase/poly-beta-1,6-N-acetylglucosamine synthase-like glycosyltransferase
MRAIFWASLAVIFYVYAGYPLALVVAMRRSPSVRREKNFLPSVSLVIAAYNEEKVLGEKIENSLSLDYPKDRLEIVIASDGSTDRTNVIAEAYAAQGIGLQKIAPRGGKTRALSLTIPKTRGDILILSDANTMYQRDAIRQLVRHFADPPVGVVSGDVRLVNAAETHAHSEGVYYRYERWLQQMESQIGSIIGADGAMYAVARHLFKSPSENIIIDDFVISMTVAQLGYRVLYEPEAVAIEQGTLSSQEEFRRKVRIVAGGIQALKCGEGLPRWRQPLLMFCYLSHKFLRWLLPCFLLLVFFASVSLLFNPFYLMCVLGQVLFYGVSAAYGMGILGGRWPSWGGIPYYFALVNSAALIGLWKGLLGTQMVTWQRTRR